MLAKAPKAMKGIVRKLWHFAFTAGLERLRAEKAKHSPT